MCRKMLLRMQSFILVLAFVLLPFPAKNQLVLAETASPTYAASYDYVIGSGDVLEISVWGHADLSGVVTVRDDGKISLAGLPEEICVLGLTVPEVQVTLADRLAYYLKNPKVAVTLREAKMIRVTVIGSVRSPGVYPFRIKPTLIDALASAGGHMSEADLTCIRITRAITQASAGDIKSTLIVANVDKVLKDERDSKSNANIVLQDGDVVYVPERAVTVSVLGEVQKPGVYTVNTSPTGTRVFDVIAAAGGPGIDADTSCIRVIRHDDRETRTLEIDLDTLEATRSKDSGAAEQYDGTFKLVPGDIVYVPRAIRVQVLGQVRNPGSYQLRAKSTFVHAIAQAGGLLDSADTTCISLHRGANEAASAYTLDLDSALRGNLPREKLTVKDQDTIIVPELVREVSVLGAVNKPGVFKIQKDTRILQVLALAGGIAQNSDGASAMLTRRLQSGETQHLPIDLERLQSATSEADNCPVYNGDIIYVPQAITVMVLGQVKAPGTYALGSASKLMDAISRAGGVLPEGDQTRVSLTRNGERPEVREVNVKAAMAGASESNIDLIDGDIVFVPELIRKISVLGEVAHPGVYKIRDDTTLLECLALAGGITEMGDAASVRITRHNPDGIPVTHTVDTDDIHLGADPGTGIWTMVNGDIIYVPRAIAVQVLGEVAQPGLYRMKAGSRLSDAVALAGGLKDDADSSQIIVTTRTPSSVTTASMKGHVKEDGAANLTEGLVQAVDITGVLMGSNLSDNILLSDQDTVFVPRLNREVVVVGEVVRPGLYKLQRNGRLMDAMAAAGGPTKRAALEAVCIFREGQVAAGEQVILGRDNVFFTGHAEENPEVQGQDIVYVPSSTKIEWDRVFSFLSGLKLIKDLFLR